MDVNIAVSIALATPIPARSVMTAQGLLAILATAVQAAPVQCSFNSPRLTGKTEHLQLHAVELAV